MTSRPLCRSSPGLEARTPSLGAAVALAPLTGRLATASDDPKNVPLMRCLSATFAVIVQA